MKILNFVMLSVFLVQFSGPAQELYIPKEIRKTYINGTRDLSGNPGSKFWQNKPEYKIEASIDSYRRTIAGKEVIMYSNNSPDTLRTIVIRLYQDFHKPGKSRDWETDEKHLNEGVKLHGITLNGYDIALNEKNVSRPGTRIRIISGVSINPGETAEIGIEWSFSLSEENSRMGVYDSTSYMIAYWYPQISVYDDIDGWDESDYNGLVEFYNEFADFDVRIKTDRPGLCVWSTGELRNPQDVFSEEFLKEYISVKNGNSKLKADLSEPETRNRIFKNNGSAVWNYTARNVPDFAFAMSDHYVWEMKKVETSKGRSALLNTAFRPNATALNKHNVFDIAEKYLKYASAEFPGVPYPYPSMTVFNGDGGMEFPMMVNDDDTQTWNSTVYLTSHEMSHTYFPFYMGISETRYGWMDEGWAVYLPQDFQTMMQKYVPDDEKNNNYRTDSREYNTQAYERTSGTMNDIPMLAPSNKIKNPSYRINAYNKAALVYDVLKDMLGKELFLNCLQEFMDRWNGKHPMPYDFFFTFNDVSKQNLNWFWKKWFMEYGAADLAIGEVKHSGSTAEVEIINKGGMPVPVELSVISNQKTENSYYKTARIWETGKDRVVIKIDIKDKNGTIKLGNKYIPDINKGDNSYNF